MRQIKKHAVVLGVLFTLALTGCGKKIPECGDQQAQDLIYRIAKDNFQKMAPIVGNKYLELANSTLERPVFVLNSAAPTFVQKLTNFASQKQDKDVGLNYCTAMVSGELLWEIKLKFNSSDQYADLQEIVDFMTSKAKFAIETDAETKQFGGTVTGEKGLITVKVKSPLPESISYTTQMTDKGDSLLVNVGKEK